MRELRRGIRAQHLGKYQHGDGAVPIGYCEWCNAFLAAIAREVPCFYAFGNHEHWSERIPEMREILLSVGVTVLVGEVKTVKMRGVDIDVCGIDDPTYMSDDAWL
ncbi:MAG: hypothetical protein IKJ89_11005, partial [Kiritimatiellae bacterium]|nr:hypothetical protein [Kiritimatiellia bacterium]